MTESDIDWSDEGAESERSTENEGQDSDGEEGQIDIESPVEKGLSEVDSDFDQDDNTSLRGTLGFAVLANFSCGFSVILIVNCGVAVFSKPAGCVFFMFWSTIFGIKTYPSLFSDHLYLFSVVSEAP